MGISSRRMRGIGFEVEEMMKLFLVIIIGLGVVILIIAASGGISSLLNDFCAKNPTICGTAAQNTKDYQTAQNSVNALVCAINSVAKGQNMCTGLSTTTNSIERNFGFTGFALSNDNSAGPTVKCQSKAASQFVNPKTVKIAAGITPDPTKYFNCVPDTSTPSMGLTASIPQVCYTCEQGVWEEKTKQCALTSTYSCTVSNFQLPQKVQDKQIWGMTYGDPQFIAYWQVFPVEADTWSFKVDWKIHAAIALITILPPTKVAAGLAKLGVAQAAASITGREAETTLTNELLNIVKQRATAKGALKAVTKAGVLEGAALAAEYVSSTRAKFLPDKNSFVMKSPYENKQVFSLVSELEGKSVFLEWPTNDVAFGGATNTAHFVSPCNIQSMDVEKGSVLCDQYFINGISGIVQCMKFSSMEKASDQNGAWYSFKQYVSKLFASGTDPTCDIKTYIGANEPYINDINAIKGATVEAVAQKLFNGNVPQPKSCDEGSTEATATLNGKSYNISDCYKNSPAKIDTIEIKDGNKVETLLDTDFDGTFDSYMLKGCKTDTIIISNVKKATVSNDYNYCFDQTARYLSWGQAATYGAAAGTAIVFAIAFPPSSIVSGLAAIASIVTVQQGTYEAITEYDKARNSWPGTTGG